jgi:hypothetical protein
MADDIRLFVGFPDHPKTIKLVRRAGEGAVRCLLRLWLYVREHHPTTGRLAGMEDEDIEIAAGWTGDLGVFVDALRQCRFLDGNELHGWEERQWYAVNEEVRSDKAALSALKRYHSDADALALLKQRQAKRSQCGRSAVAVQEDCATHAPVPPLPVPSRPDQTIPPNQDQERGGTAKKPRAPRATFQAPSVEEVTAYGMAEHLGSKRTVQDFHDHFTANGWKVGRSPMKDWRAAYRKWARREPEFAGTNGTRKATRGMDAAMDLLREAVERERDEEFRSDGAGSGNPLSLPPVGCIEGDFDVLGEGD